MLVMHSCPRNTKHQGAYIPPSHHWIETLRLLKAVRYTHCLQMEASSSSGMLTTPSHALMVHEPETEPAQLHKAPDRTVHVYHPSAGGNARGREMLRVRS